MKELIVTDASISTATVDIQVIRIGSKQMTLAVFRQLPHKDIFDEDGHLVASPWGWVNYERDGGTPFVFSYEGTLYRYSVNTDAYYDLILQEDIEKRREEAHYDSTRGEWINSRVLDIPSGRWLIKHSDKYCHSPVRRSFISQQAAADHLTNRLAGIAILEHAPQLFIAI